MLVRIEVPLRISVDTFWQKLFFNHDYNRGLYEALGFQSFELLHEEHLSDGRVRRSIRAEPPVRAPELLKRKLSARLSYVDDGEFDPARRIWTFRNESSIAKDSTKIGGTIRVEPTATGCTQIIELDLSVRAFGLGGLAERVIESNMRDSYKTTADYLHRYAEQHGLLVTAVASV